MTPIKVKVTFSTTTTRTMELSARQVANIVLRWARREHGFGDGAAVACAELRAFTRELGCLTIAEEETVVEEREVGE